MRSLPRWVLMAIVTAAMLLTGLAATYLFWPKVELGRDDAALASLALPRFAGRIEAVHVASADKPIPVVLRDGELWPTRQVGAVERLLVSVTVRRPSWLTWLVGRTERRTFTIVTPAEPLADPLLQVRSGAPVAITFDVSVAKISLGGTFISLPAPRRSVLLGVVANRKHAAGSVTVAAAARSWERLSPPVRVSWFVARSYPQLLADPDSSARLSPAGPLTLTFSEPVSEVLGSARPAIEPATAGHWRLIDAHTLSFWPAGMGFALGERVSVVFPIAVHLAGKDRSTLTRTLTWQVPQGSVLRVQQLLAELGYLPLRWRANGAALGTLASQLAATVSPPAGEFSWRYPSLREPLRPLWQAGQDNVVLRGALMAFEDDHGLASDGVLGPEVWDELVQAALHHQTDRQPYDYISVSEANPEVLSVWRNGRVVYRSPCNTGIAVRPTALGTYPVYARYLSTTMSGTNPDGTPYNDPGVPYVAYFNGGDAVHGFLRPGYGYPQSLGCVELPYSAAAVVYTYDSIGTLVSVS